MKMEFTWTGCMTVTELDEAMLARMKEIVYTEHRPFCYKDFETFVINGKTYNVAHGTFRNKISELLKAGEIELEFNSKICFYTLKGIHFGNRMTRNHMDISPVIPVTGIMANEMEDLLNYLKTIPAEEASVHDLHHKFVVPDIYQIMSTSTTYSRLINSRSKDIILPHDIIDGLKIQCIIHRTDTVTVSVACSNFPIAINADGLLRASVALTIAEE
jgi:hypothetical protein